jgi:hypothetical protein
MLDKEAWTNRFDIVARHTAPQKSARSENSWPLIETGADGLSPERFAGNGIGLSPTVCSKI